MAEVSVVATFFLRCVPVSWRGFNCLSVTHIGTCMNICCFVFCNPIHAISSNGSPGPQATTPLPPSPLSVHHWLHCTSGIHICIAYINTEQQTLYRDPRSGHELGNPNEGPLYTCEPDVAMQIRSRDLVNTKSGLNHLTRVVTYGSSSSTWGCQDRTTSGKYFSSGKSNIMLGFKDKITERGQQKKRY